MTLTPAYEADEALHFVVRTCPTCLEQVTMPEDALSCGYCLYGKPRTYWSTHHSEHGFRYLPQPLANLRTVRMRVGLNMRRLSLESGVALATIRDQERGKRDMVRSDVAERLARALDVHVEELF